jgi:hypothetical protein
MVAKEAELKARTTGEPVPAAPPVQVLVVEAADALPSRAGPRRRSRR